MNKLSYKVGSHCVDVFNDSLDLIYEIPFTQGEVESAAIDVFISDCNISKDNIDATKAVLNKYCEYYGIDALIKDYSDEIADKLYNETKELL